MNEYRPDPRTATPEEKRVIVAGDMFSLVIVAGDMFLSGDSSWGYDMFCGWKQAWLSWGEY